MLRYAITKTFDAPIAYAYAWLTDFRTEDPKIINDPYPRHILRRSKDSFVWIQHYNRDGKEKEGVRIVTLQPPNAWHNEAIIDEKETALDYRLTALGKQRTKITIRVKVSFKTIEETEADLARNLNGIWDKYIAALERDFRSGKDALA